MFNPRRPGWSSVFLKGAGIFPKRKSMETNERTNGREIMTLEEAAAFLGYKKSYLYRLTSTRQIPYFKFNGWGIRFERAALEKWMRERMQAIPTQAETTAKAAAYCAAKNR